MRYSGLVSHLTDGTDWVLDDFMCRNLASRVKSFGNFACDMNWKLDATYRDQSGEFAVNPARVWVLFRKQKQFPYEAGLKTEITDRFTGGAPFRIQASLSSFLFSSVAFRPRRVLLCFTYFGPQPQGMCIRGYNLWFLWSIVFTIHCIYRNNKSTILNNSHPARMLFTNTNEPSSVPSSFIRRYSSFNIRKAKLSCPWKMCSLWLVYGRIARKNASKFSISKFCQILLSDTHGLHFSSSSVLRVLHFRQLGNIGSVGAAPNIKQELVVAEMIADGGDFW